MPFCILRIDVSTQSASPLRLPIWHKQEWLPVHNDMLGNGHYLCGHSFIAVTSRQWCSTRVGLAKTSVQISPSSSHARSHFDRYAPPQWWRTRLVIFLHPHYYVDSWKPLLECRAGTLVHWHAPDNKRTLSVFITQTSFSGICCYAHFCYGLCHRLTLDEAMTDILVTYLGVKQDGFPGTTDICVRLACLFLFCQTSVSCTSTCWLR